MTRGLLETIAERFATFTAPYLAEPGDGFAYEIKVAHTARVVALAREIATAEGVDGELLAATLVAAQLHDLGRFPQYRQYRTFRDAVSANHAALSIRHILRSRILHGLPPALKRLALGAVYLHNKRLLPGGLPAGLDTAARIVRDSDKLDIFPVMIKHFSQETPAHPEVALDVEMHPTAYSQCVVDDLRRRVPGDYTRIVYANDFKLMVVGWVYDLNFRSSARILRNRGYIDTIFAGLPDDAQMRAAKLQLDQDLARRIEGD